MSSSEADIERILSWLKPVRLCAGLSTEQLAAVASQLQLRPFVAGETLAFAGRRSPSFGSWPKVRSMFL